jgi:hypothetical protein
VSVHKARTKVRGYFVDSLGIFSPKHPLRGYFGCKNTFFKEAADLRSESIMCLHYRQTLFTPGRCSRGNCKIRQAARTPVLPGHSNSLHSHFLIAAQAASSLRYILPVLAALPAEAMPCKVLIRTGKMS